MHSERDPDSEGLFQDLLSDAEADLPVSPPRARSAERPPTIRRCRRTGRVFAPMDFQEEVLTAIESHVSHQGEIAALVSLPTGAGKTSTIAYLMLRLLDRYADPGATVLWITPTKDSKIQVFEKLGALWDTGAGPSALDIVDFVSSSTELTGMVSRIVVMTPNMLSYDVAKSALSKLEIVGAVLDEAHHVPAQSLADSWRWLRETLLTQRSLRVALGLSATPHRRNEQETALLRHSFDDCLIAPESLDPNPFDLLVNKGVMAAPSPYQIPLSDRSLVRTGSASGRANLYMLAKPERFYSTVNAALELADRQTVVFAFTRDHGRAIAKALRHRHCEALYVDGETPLDARITALDMFASGETRVLVNVGLFTEAIDFPGAENLILSYPISSIGRLQQIIGRVARGPRVGGTTHCLIASIEDPQLIIRDVRNTYGLQASGWYRLDSDL